MISAVGAQTIISWHNVSTLWPLRTLLPVSKGFFSEVPIMDFFELQCYNSQLSRGVIKGIKTNHKDIWFRCFFFLKIYVSASIPYGCPLDLSAPFLTEQPANVSGRAVQDCLNVWTSEITWEVWMEILSPSFGPAPAIAFIWGVSQQTEKTISSLHLCLCNCLSNK